MSAVHRLVDGEDVDFSVLAIVDEDFAKVLDDKGRLDFHNPRCVKQLTASILKQDFGLKIELPDDRLCPPVPVRYAYVRWIQDLIDTTSPTFTDTYDPDRHVTGIDIGVGASCIYPLLATSSRPSWTMYGSELDTHSLSCASQNITLNDLSSRIHLTAASGSKEAKLLPLDLLGVQTADFIMCNPPFYASKAEIKTSEDMKGLPPSAVCTGADVEMVCEGGDVGFVSRIVDESCEAGMRERVQWFSSMLGKWASVESVVRRVREAGVENWAVCSLRGGKGRTQRWAVAWSWGKLRPRADVARRGVASRLGPFPSRSSIPLQMPNQTFSIDPERARELVLKTVTPLNMRWTWVEDDRCFPGIGFAKENVWSRAARRKRKRQEADEAIPDSADRKDGFEGGSVALAVKISITKEEIEIRWLQGTDALLYESFCSMLRRVFDQVRGNQNAMDRK